MRRVDGELVTNKMKRALCMLKWMSIAPGLHIETLALLIGVSKRNVYRYISELKSLGIPITIDKGRGYSIQDTNIRWIVRLAVADVGAPEGSTNT